VPKSRVGPAKYKNFRDRELTSTEGTNPDQITAPPEEFPAT
jgi:hypothetical protein